MAIAHVYIHRLEEVVEQAGRTDREVNVLLPFVPMLVFLSGIAALFAGAALMPPVPAGGPQALGLAMVVLGLLIIGAAVMLYVTYLWITRVNMHLERTAEGYDLMARIAEEVGLHNAPLIRSRLHEVKMANEKRISVPLGLALLFVPLGYIYVFHLLNKRLAAHSSAERLFLAELMEGIRRRDPSFSRLPDDVRPVPDRSTFLYALLTVLTGIFMLYWVYTLTKDPNEHFASHRRVEREILDSLKRLARGA